MSYHARRILTPGSSRKRKDRDVVFPATSTKPLASVSAKKGADPEPQPYSSNRLLAGYMAHEFLTKGTVFGQNFDPARAEAVPVNSAADPKRNNRQLQLVKSSAGEAEPSCKPKPQSYVDVANLLKSDGAHVPGIVNPTELAQWIQM